MYKNKKDVGSVFLAAQAYIYYAPEFFENLWRWLNNT